MFPSPWVVTDEHVVHLNWCTVPGDERVVPYLSTATTATQMLANIARFDFKDGHHAPNVLKACSSCIEQVAKTEPKEAVDV